MPGDGSGGNLLNGRPVRVLCEENVLEEAAVCETLTESDMTPPREIDTRRENVRREIRENAAGRGSIVATQLRPAAKKLRVGDCGPAKFT